MELTKELIEAHSITPEGVIAINGFGTTQENTLVASTKQEYDGKASADADKIIDGAFGKIEAFAGSKRETGEKAAEFFKRTWDTFSTDKIADLDAQKLVLDKKLKDAGGAGNEVLAQEFTELKGKYDALQIQEAEFKTYKEADYKGKFEALSANQKATNENLALSSVTPKYPDTVNAFEGAAMFNAAIAKIKTEYTIEFDNETKEGVAVNIENTHLRVPLKDLIAKDEAIGKLLVGRQQSGPNGKVIDKIKLDKVPFEIPKDAKDNNEARTKAIRDYLTSEAGGAMNPITDTYTEQFSKYNNLILGVKVEKAA